MKITNVNVMKLEESGNGRLKAIASILIDNEFAVNDIKVIKGNNGLFLAMPSRRTINGDFKDIAHPINQETRDKIQKAILEKYYEEDKEDEKQ